MRPASLTPSQIEDLPALIQQLGSHRAVARALGVTRDAVGYHARGGKAHLLAKQIERERRARA